MQRLAVFLASLFQRLLHALLNFVSKALEVPVLELPVLASGESSCRLGTFSRQAQIAAVAAGRPPRVRAPQLAHEAMLTNRAAGASPGAGGRARGEAREEL